METEDFPPTTKAVSAPLSGSKSAKMTDRDFLTEMERLAVAYPRTDMDPRKWRILWQTYWDDLSHLTLAQLRDGCARYRRNSENRFFPSPGQLLEAARNPFESRGASKAAFKDDLPPAVADEVAKAMIARAEALGGFAKKATGEKSTAELKAEILARRPLVMTSEMVELEKALYRERMDNLEKRLGTRHA